MPLGTVLKPKNTVPIGSKKYKEMINDAESKKETKQSLH